MSFFGHTVREESNFRRVIFYIEGAVNLCAICVYVQIRIKFENDISKWESVNKNKTDPNHVEQDRCCVPNPYVTKYVYCLPKMFSVHQIHIWDLSNQNRSKRTDEWH